MNVGCVITYLLPFKLTQYCSDVMHILISLSSGSHLWHPVITERPSHQVMSLVLCLEFIKSLNMELIFSLFSLLPRPLFSRVFSCTLPIYLDAVPCALNDFLLSRYALFGCIFCCLFATKFLFFRLFRIFVGSLLNSRTHTFCRVFPFSDLLEERKSLFPA